MDYDRVTGKFNITAVDARRSGKTGHILAATFVECGLLPIEALCCGPQEVQCGWAYKQLFPKGE